MKRVTLLFVLVLLCANFVFAYDLNVTVANNSIKQAYAPGELISGKFNMNLTNAPVNLYFSSEFGTMGLREFLKANGLPLTCENSNCSDIISLANAGETTKLIVLNGSGEKRYALAITDSGVSITRLLVNFSSNFPESDSLPLDIIVADSISVGYNYFSSAYTRQVTSGCFDSNSPSMDLGRDLDSTGYCEKVSLQSSSKYLIGANISGSGLADLEFSLRNNIQELGKCSFSLNSGTTTTFTNSVSCLVNTTSVNPAGNYSICVKNTYSNNYKIKSETSGSNCGYHGISAINANSTNDYAIYVKLPRYAAATASSFSLDEINGGKSILQSYIFANYPSGCANTCVIPIKFKGTNQNLNVQNIALSYNANAGSTTVNKIYEINYVTRKANFSGELNLEKFNWSLSGFGNKSFNLELLGDGTKKILNSTLRVLSLPVIEGISPMIFPAGIDALIFANVRNPGNYSRYEWDFGDNSSKVVTNVSYAKHFYSNVSNYTLTIKFGEGNYTTSNSFTVSAVNPKDYLNSTFSNKRTNLNHANTDLLALPSWYQNYVSRKVDLDYYQTELNRLESKRTVAYTEQEFLEVAKGIYNLNMPFTILATEKMTGPLVGDYNQFNPLIVQEIFPSSIENDSDVYRGPIFAWQLKNIQAMVTKTKLQLLDEKGKFSDIILVYDVSLTSSSKDESYFVIQKDFVDVNFNSANTGGKKAGSSTYVTIPSEGTVSFSFFVNGSQEPVMFVSPKLSLLATSQRVGVCNYNARCEKNLDENSDNCRSDCAPIGWTWFWLILFLFCSLIVYTILQVWYKRKYEEYLFRDRNEMYNLISFIENARMSKLSNNQISAILVQKGWDKDQVEYALLRSEGKNPGMFEIIPVDKIVSVMEKKKSVSTSQKPVAPVNPYPAKPGVQKPAFNPFGQQAQPSQNPNQLNKGATGFRQQNDTKY